MSKFETIEPSDSRWNWGKHLFIALFTGGLSLLFVLGCRLPSLWEQVCVLRSDWIKKGRDPRTWEWIGRGWLAAMGTILVLVPAAMALTASLSLFNPQAFFMQHSGTPHISRLLIVAIIIPMTAMATGVAIILTWMWHTLRQSVSLIWSFTKFSRTREVNS